MEPDQVKPSDESELALLASGLDILKIGHTPGTFGAFHKYLQVLYAFRGRLHLLSRCDYNRITLRHFLPSLLVLPYLEGAGTVADIGAGAGFPSVPLKIIRPDIAVTLFESVGKRAEFLRYLVRELGFEKISVKQMRAEDYDGEKFAAVLARASGKIRRFAGIIDRAVSDGGRVVLIKSKRVGEELARAKKMITDKKLTVTVDHLTTPVEKVPITIVVLKKPAKDK